MFRLAGLAVLVAVSPISATGQEKSEAKKAIDGPEKLICKRFVETGSLVRSSRVCKTKHDWDREQEDVRASGPAVDSCRARADGGQC